jgi:hypothetical protein
MLSGDVVDVGKAEKTALSFTKQSDAIYIPLPSSSLVALRKHVLISPVQARFVFTEFVLQTILDVCASITVTGKMTGPLRAAPMPVRGRKRYRFHSSVTFGFLGFCCLVQRAQSSMGQEEARLYDRNLQHFSPEGRIYQVKGFLFYVVSLHTGL